LGTTPKIILRKMTPKDLPAVHKIETDSYKIPLSINHYLKYLQSEENLGLIAQVDKKIAGYVMLKFSGEIATVMTFTIAAEFRGRGIGKKFFWLILSVIKHNGGKIVKLHVRANNIAAIHVYKSCGLKLAERLKNFYALIHEDAFLMERQI